MRCLQEPRVGDNVWYHVRPDYHHGKEYYAAIITHLKEGGVANLLVFDDIEHPFENSYDRDSSKLTHQVANIQPCEVGDPRPYHWSYPEAMVYTMRTSGEIAFLLTEGESAKLQQVLAAPPREVEDDGEEDTE